MKFEVAMSNGLREDAFTRKKVVKVTQNVIQYPPNYMTYAPAKFEVAMSNSLGEDAFTRKYIICH